MTAACRLLRRVNCMRSMAQRCHPVLPTRPVEVVGVLLIQAHITSDAEEMCRQTQRTEIAVVPVHLKQFV